MKKIQTFISCWYYMVKACLRLKLMEKKQLKYTSQNELLNIIAQHVLVHQFQSTFYTIMIDETTDSSNVEQVVIVISGG